MKNHSRFRKFLIGAAIVISNLFQKTALFRAQIADFFFDATIYRGRPGAIEFGVSEEAADGLIRFRSKDDYGQPIVRMVTFRCTNRWPLRSGRLPIGRFRLAIHSAAVLDGMKVIDITWGTYHGRQVRVPALEMAA